MPERTVRGLLLYPPLMDPTAGYHSLTYLQTFVHARGHTGIQVKDCNIEGLCHLATPQHLHGLIERAATLRSELGDRPFLRGSDQITYYHAWLAQWLNPDEVMESLDRLRSPDAFYEPEQYRKAVQTFQYWVKCLSLNGFPGQFSNLEVPTHGWLNLNRVEDLTSGELLERFSSSFEPYYQEVLLPQLRAGRYEVVGLNITYTAQLPFALYLARLLRQEFPGLFLIAGGTEVSDCYKYSRLSDHFRAVFDPFDAVVIGEGETPFLQLLDALAAGEVPAAATNLLLHQRYQQEEPYLPVPIRYEELQQIPTPDYSDLPWELYLSPERYVYYSPSRGCYWNKCTFCDYGLNFGSPTAPWRADPVEKMVEDLRQIAQQTRFVYFSVDVLAPATLLKLAQRLVEEEIRIYWSAEIRLEQYWSVERCQLLRDSGCVCISVGFESGNQRILDLIRKGTRPAQVQETMRNFWQAGIGVQIMGFTHFPSETLAEAMESVQFLAENREYWTFGSLGQFVLTPGALVAQRPAEFGIEAVRPVEGEEISRSLTYSDSVHRQQTADDPDWEQRLQQAKASLGGGYPRPFMGGVDTPHTLMYHARFGTEARTVWEHGQGFDEGPLMITGRVITVPNGYQPIQLLRSLAPIHRDALAQGRGLSHRELQAALQGRLLQPADEAVTYLLARDGRLYTATPSLLSLLQAIAQHRTVPALERERPDWQAVDLPLLKWALAHGIVDLGSVPVVSPVLTGT